MESMKQLTRDEMRNIKAGISSEPSKLGEDQCHITCTHNGNSRTLSCEHKFLVEPTCSVTAFGNVLICGGVKHKCCEIFDTCVN